ncbi:MAG TPA: TAT-variant-translocated molybdopterin oxidoreductase [Vicinamibacterales bacterium]|nr:TAT-variant-translocated molybdopterin oxidoreductase [Vicinamibacterales bacterium]
MDFSAIRSRLAGAQGRLYWRSLGELADTPAFREYLHREFPEQASQWNDPKGRRQFLKLMSASLALAGIGACTKQPPEKIIPYVRQPEDLVPGKPLFFATALPFGGIAAPVLVESHEGHPTKVEGNLQHPASLGATDAFGQAGILDLYDPDRAQTVTARGEVRGWGDFTNALASVLAVQKSKQGSGIRFLTETITSPTFAEQVELIRADYPQAKWHQWDPVTYDAAREAARQQAGHAADAVYHLDKADVVVSLEADFLTTGPGHVRHMRDFADGRRITDDHKVMNRLYVVESTPTLTGAKADHRLALPPSAIEGFARELAARLGAGVAAGEAAGGVKADAQQQKWATAIAGDLQAHRGRSLIVPGEYQPLAVHTLASAMNQALGNVGQTVTYQPAVDIHSSDRMASLRDLTRAMDAGQVELLVIVGSNPVFTAPSDFRFVERLAKVPLIAHFSQYFDETSANSHWNLPASHPLESWSDARAYDGTVTVMQPLIAPLYDTRTVHELLALFITAQTGKSSHDLVKDYWTRAYAGKAGNWTIHDSAGNPFKSPESFWTHTLHDGFIPGTAGNVGVAATASAAPAPAVAAPAASRPAASGTLELIFRPDPFIWDGRFANNGWLQEMPKHISKITWDPAAWLSPRLAESKGLNDGDLIELRYRGNTARLPVTIVPGHPDGAVTAFLGYGREHSGRVGTPADETAKGFNIYKLRTSDAPWFDSGLDIVKIDGARYLLARTQEHHLMEGRAPVRAGTIDEYRSDPKFVGRMGETPPRGLTLIPEWQYNNYKWGMAIDLTSCTGCGTCTIACVSENNIAVVGKEQVYKGRDMHWIRVDHYFAGDLENPEMYHQPVPCMQCEMAPCELVCPVGATTHSAEGLNDMVYNRCVGTRYCSNNCPYKVRRFNFLLYSDWYTQSFYPLRNPDVTVRSRGVMEKCTYCVQRINAARITSEKEDRKIRDGEIVPACAGACPAEAIVFGDLNDPNSRVTKLKQQDRNYGILEELNTRPRTSYLAALRNPNPALEPSRGASTTEH